MTIIVRISFMKSPYSNNYFPNFGQIMGFSSLIVMIGMASGPVIVATLTDSTGTYRWGFIVVALLAGLGTSFFVFATPPKPPVRDSRKSTPTMA